MRKSKIIFIFLLLIFIINIFSVKAFSKDYNWINYGIRDRLIYFAVSGNGQYTAAIIKTDTTKIVVFDNEKKTILWSKKYNLASCSISNDGKYLAFVTGLNTGHYAPNILYLIDWQKDTILIKEPNDYIYDIRFSPNNNVMAISTFQQDTTPDLYKLLFYNLQSYKLKGFIPTGYPHSIRFSNDGSRLFLTASETYIDSLYLAEYNVTTCDLIRKVYIFDNQYPQFELNYSGKEYITTDFVDMEHSKLVVRDLTTGKTLRETIITVNAIANLRYSPDFKQIAFSLYNQAGGITILDSKTLNVISEYSVPDFIPCIEFFGKSNNIMYCYNDKLKIRNTTDGSSTELLSISQSNNHKNFVSQAIISPDGKFIASCDADEKIKFWDAETGAFIKEFVDSNSNIKAICFSEDGKFLFSSAVMCGTNLLKWDVATGSIVKKFNLDEKRIFQPIIAQKGKILLFTNRYGMAYFYDIVKEKYYDSVITEGVRVEDIAISGSGKYFVAGSNKYNAWINTSAGYQIDHIFPSNDCTRFVDLSPNDSLLVYGLSGATQEESVISTSDWSELFLVNRKYLDKKGLTKYLSIHKVKFSIDNNYLLLSSGGVQKMMRLSNDQIFYVYNPDYDISLGYIESIETSPDNKILVTGSDDGTIVRWNTDWIFNDVKMDGSETNNISIFPNPVCEYLNIKSHDEINNIVITDILGKSTKISTKSYKNNICSYDVSELRAGIYLLSYINGKDIKTIKFIKE